ncbi:unnamed protein product [Arabidopsis thaliana]|uniref:116kDa U5 small nuclear ribonucleoprotein component N-terminal domain-containing protein n=1 Tax=Arabidopsis thaliana TaxID=3702 RepID=A0A654FLV7_ARATH|nr:unnamed protein product [Arabidopsis thaliana]
MANMDGWIITINDVEIENQIVLPDDKKYYPTLEEVYGEYVDTFLWLKMSSLLSNQ